MSLGELDILGWRFKGTGFLENRETRELPGIRRQYWLRSPSGSPGEISMRAAGSRANLCALARDLLDKIRLRDNADAYPLGLVTLG
jgi:hypothetical protein